MYELYPYFTNDGSVGLFSRQDDDIYHSTYGALTESWQKFIIPSHFEEYLQTHSEVKILDVCYGIGYNSKTALNVFINNLLNNKQILKKTKNNLSNKIKNFFTHAHNIAAIGTDNIQGDIIQKISLKNENLSKYFDNNAKNNINAPSLVAAIDTDNVLQGEAYVNLENICENQSQINNSKDENGVAAVNATKIVQKTDNTNLVCSKILIDAVDVDRTLIHLSPFIADASWRKFLFEKDLSRPLENRIKYQQIKNMKSPHKKLKRKFKLRKEVSIILLEKMFNQNKEFFSDPILRVLLSNKKYSPYVSKFMVNLAKFYSNQGCNHNKTLNKSTFLHNIYYRYLSKSYKNAKKLLKSCKIDMNFHKKDARAFIKSTENKYDFIFLDAFTPTKCPALWTVHFFKELYCKLNEGGMLVTYSTSAAIRNALLQNGFCVGKIYDRDLKKFVGTVAAKNKELIEHELSELDLDLINSKAGICFEDKTLDLSNDKIIENRNLEVLQSNLTSSSSVMKGYKNGHIESV